MSLQTSARKVLVVEDEEAVVSIYGRILASMGLEVVSACDGEQALERLGAQAPHGGFALVISDLMMPRMTGTELLRRIRTSQETASCPVIIVSAYLSPHVATEFRKLGQIQILPKPFLSKDIVEAVNTALNGPTTDVEFSSMGERLQALITAAVAKVFHIMTHEELRLGAVKAKAPDEPSGDVSAVIDFSINDYMGSLAIAFSEASFIETFSQMMDQRIDHVDAVSQDAAAELLNVVYGDVKTALNQLGFKMSLAIPRITVARGHSVPHAACGPVVLLHFSSDARLDACRIELALNGEEIVFYKKR